MNETLWIASRCSQWRNFWDSERRMRGYLIITAAVMGLAALAPAPAIAQDAEPPAELPIVDEGPIFEAVDAFMAAIGDPDKTALADHMLPDGMIFVHNLMDPTNPRVDIIPVSEHLANWAMRDGNYEEIMRGYELSVSYTMAHAWGGYSFAVDGEITHCGVNSLSLVQTEDGSWKVGNASFTMVQPEKCRFVGANWVPGAAWPTGDNE
ncbi:MAG: hypothetical protein V2I74_11765 [Erythrobacter sp.]|jgi:hypothetical protein|nr:hypothetical protein [Erythrobacter sp.]